MCRAAQQVNFVKLFPVTPTRSAGRVSINDSVLRVIEHEAEDCTHKETFYENYTLGKWCLRNTTLQASF